MAISLEGAPSPIAVFREEVPMDVIVASSANVSTVNGDDDASTDLLEN